MWCPSQEVANEQQLDFGARTSVGPIKFPERDNKLRLP
jgi:hypothetical protein